MIADVQCASSVDVLQAFLIVISVGLVAYALGAPDTNASGLVLALCSKTLIILNHVIVSILQLEYKVCTTSDAVFQHLGMA